MELMIIILAFIIIACTKCSNDNSPRYSTLQRGKIAGHARPENTPRLRDRKMDN